MDSVSDVDYLLAGDGKVCRCTLVHVSQGDFPVRQVMLHVSLRKFTIVASNVLKELVHRVYHEYTKSGCSMVK